MRFVTVFIICIMTFMGGNVFAGDKATTLKTGDIVQGVPVISYLHIKSLPAGRHDFYYQAGWRNTGAPIYVPIIVIKGKHKGPRFTLTAAIHGDELNGIRVIHQLVQDIDYKTLKGTLLAIPGLNQPGLNDSRRHYVSGGGSGAQTNLNRVVSDKIKGSAGRLYMGGIWRDLLAPNTDFAIDLHTQTTGTAYPLFVFADYRAEEIRKMAELLGADIIKKDKGEAGTLETTFVSHGIAALTFELGEPKRFQKDLIERAVSGIQNIMSHRHMIKKKVKLGKVKPFVGKRYTNVNAGIGGVAILHVNLLDRVKAGDCIASIYDPFGRKIADYKAPHNGVVLAIATDPLREAGALLVRIIR